MPVVGGERLNVRYVTEPEKSPEEAAERAGRGKRRSPALPVGDPVRSTAVFAGEAEDDKQF